MSIFLDFIECAHQQLRIVRKPICLNSAKITVYYWLKLILSGCCSSKCGIAMNIPKLCSWLPSPLFLDVLRIPCDRIGFCIFGRCWRWDVFEVAMNGCGRSEALPCDRVLWLAAGPHLLQPHTLPNHLMTTPPQPNQPPVLPHGHAQVKIFPWSGNLPGWGFRDCFECLVPLKADFYQLMPGWDDGGPLAMDVGACPPWASSAVPPAHPDKSTWHPTMSVCSLGYLTENTPGKKTSLRLGSGV